MLLKMMKMKRYFSKKIISCLWTAMLPTAFSSGDESLHRWQQLRLVLGQQQGR